MGERVEDLSEGRGDDVILARPVTSIDGIGGFYKRELRYLVEQGYRIVDGGTRMVK